MTWLSGDLGPLKNAPPFGPATLPVVPSHGPKVGGLTLTGALRQQVDLSDPKKQKNEQIPTGSYRIHGTGYMGLFTY